MSKCLGGEIPCPRWGVVAFCPYHCRAGARTVELRKINIIKYYVKLCGSCLVGSQKLHRSN